MSEHDCMSVDAQVHAERHGAALDEVARLNRELASMTALAEKRDADRTALQAKLRARDEALRVARERLTKIRASTERVETAKVANFELRSIKHNVDIALAAIEEVKP